MADNTEVVEGYEGVLKDFSDAELAEVKQIAIDFASSDVDINRICAAIIAARQLYALCRLALEKELLKEGHEWPSGVQEYLLKSMADQALQPFERRHLVARVSGIVMSFLTDDLAAELEETNAEELREAGELAERTIPFSGFEVARGEALVYIGEPDIVREYIVEGLVGLKESNDIAEEPFTVLRLKDAMQSNKVNKDAALVYQTMGINLWTNLAGSPTKLAAALETKSLTMHQSRCDVLVVDDTSKLYTGGLAGSGEAYQVSHALKRLKAWAKDSNAVLILAAPNPMLEDAEQYESDMDKLIGDHVTLVALPA
jgi:hypothetical protein